MTSLDRRVYTACALLALPLAAMQAARLARRLARRVVAWTDTVEERIANTATGRWD